MKKGFVLFLFVISSIWLSAQNKVLNFNTRGVSVKGEITTPARSVSNNQNYIDIEYNFEEAVATDIIRNNDTLQLVKIKGFGFMDDMGKPALPAYNDILAVPTKNGLSIQIIESQYKDFDDFYIYPALEPKIGDTAIQRFVLDSQLYSSNVYFPNNLVEIISIQDYREVPFAFVQIRPIQYNPVLRKLRCYSKIKYRIVFANLDTVKNIRTEHESFDVLRNVLSNPDILMELTDKNPTEPQRSGTCKDYIIITTNRFLPAVQEFAAWKRRMGYSCEIISQDLWIAPQQVKLYIPYANCDPKPEFLLIVGDHEDVPGWTNGAYATDLLYVCKGGVGDYTADMARGRVSVNSLEQAYTVLRKIIDYEKNPIIDASFYQTGLNCAQFQDDNLDGYEDAGFTYVSENVRNYLINKGKVVNRVYYANNNVYPRYYNNGDYSTGQPIPAVLRKDISPFYPWNGNNTNIVNEINAGRFYVLHRDHGGYDGWGHPDFHNTDIQNLTNDNKLPVVFSINCGTGMYNHQQECFAEKILRHPNGGAVGIFAASHSSHSGNNDGLAVGLFDAIWSNPGLVVQFGSGAISNPSLNPHSDIYKMGHVLNQGFLRMGQTWTNNYIYRQNEIYHYFGDPSMEIYTATPSNFTNAIVSIKGTSVMVNANVPGSKIVLSSIDDGQSYFEVVKNVFSYTFTNVSFPINVTISKHNYIPYLEYVVCTTTDFTSQPVNTSQTVKGCNINVQDVKVENNAKLTIDADGEVNIDGDFEIEIGSELEIK